MKFKDLLKKKMSDPDSQMSEEEQQAQLDVIQELKDMMDDHMGSKLKKVTVAAPTEEGLMEGLGMAQELAGEMEDMEEPSDELEADMDAEMDPEMDPELAAMLGEDEEEDEDEERKKSLRA